MQRLFTAPLHTSYRSSLTGFLTCRPLRVVYWAEFLVSAAPNEGITPWVFLSSWGIWVVILCCTLHVCSCLECWYYMRVSWIRFRLRDAICMALPESWVRSWSVSSQGHSISSDSSATYVYYIWPGWGTLLHYCGCSPLLWSSLWFHSYMVARSEW